MSSPSLIHACQHHRHYLTIETNAWYTLLWEPQMSLHNQSLWNTTPPSRCSFNFPSPTTFSKYTTCSDTAELVTLHKDQSSAQQKLVLCDLCYRNATTVFDVWSNNTVPGLMAIHKYGLAHKPIVATLFLLPLARISEMKSLGCLFIHSRVLPCCPGAVQVSIFSSILWKKKSYRTFKMHETDRGNGALLWMSLEGLRVQWWMWGPCRWSKEWVAIKGSKSRNGSKRLWKSGWRPLNDYEIDDGSTAK